MALILATILVSPHLISYDLTITLVGLLPLWDWVCGNRSAEPKGSALHVRVAGVLAYLVYFTPAVLIAKLIYAQPTTISMLLLLMAVTLLARQHAVRATS